MLINSKSNLNAIRNASQIAPKGCAQRYFKVFSRPWLPPTFQCTIDELMAGANAMKLEETHRRQIKEKRQTIWFSSQNSTYQPALSHSQLVRNGVTGLCHHVTMRFLDGLKETVAKALSFGRIEQVMEQDVLCKR